MRFLDFTTITPREIAPGYFGRYLHSDQITQGRVDITSGATIPDHSHPHEQWTLLLSGSFELTPASIPRMMLQWVRSTSRKRGKVISKLWRSGSAL